MLKDNQWEVFVADEVRMELEALSRRAWLQKGTRTIVKVNRERIARICIVWDNAKFHKGKEIQKALQKGGLLEKVHLI